MVSFRRALMAGVATLLVATACTSVTIPSFPPVNIPSFSIPSFSIPSFSIPSIVPGGQGAACSLVTQDEAAGVYGGPVTLTSGTDNTCTITSNSDALKSVVIRTGTGETIATAKLITSNGQDLTVAGLPAYYGELLGGILYVEKNGQDLVLQAPLNTQFKDQLVALATIAVSRWP
jgi:hypothetical protein